METESVSPYLSLSAQNSEERLKVSCLVFSFKLHLSKHGQCSLMVAENNKRLMRSLPGAQ